VPAEHTHFDPRVCEALVQSSVLGLLYIYIKIANCFGLSNKCSWLFNSSAIQHQSSSNNH